MSGEESRRNFCELERNNGAYLLLLERLEDDGRVDAIEEFGRKRMLQDPLNCRTLRVRLPGRLGNLT